MRVILLPFCLIVILIAACDSKKEKQHTHHETQDAPADTTRKSIPKTEHAQVGKAHVMITYHAPAVRGRTIWGGLVPYGEVWVTGAHQATAFEINRDFSVAGQQIPAGKYAVFTIPGQDSWTIILNKRWDQHLTDEYDTKDDVVRTEIIPVAADQQERLKYTVTARSDNEGLLTIRWEKIKLELPFEIK